MIVRFVIALAAVACLALSVVRGEAQGIETHYAPAENLEHIDGALIRSAKHSIDMAAYVLSDWPVIEALIAAQNRGVTIRIVLDPTQPHALNKLTPIAADIRMKPKGPFMHLKSYSVDGEALRAGAANFSASGLKQQNNDIVILRRPDSVRVFGAMFEKLWESARPLNQINSPSPKTSRVSALKPLTPNSACLIKGNVNRQGERIYHEPGDRDYARVNMSKGVGERWFCNEAEAQAAGWRHAGVRP